VPPRTGDLIVARGLASLELVEAAHRESRARGEPIASRLLALGVEEGELASVLAERHGVPGVDLSRSVLDLAALALVPRTVAEADAILPLSTEGGRLHLAVASPDASERIVAEVRFVTGREVSIYVAVLAALRDAIDGAYGARDSGAATWRGETAPLDAPPRLALREPPPRVPRVGDEPAITPPGRARAGGAASGRARARAPRAAAPRGRARPQR